jgi:hypothetical protein
MKIKTILTTVAALIFTCSIASANYSALQGVNNYIMITEQQILNNRQEHVSYLLNVFTDSNLFIFYGINCVHGYGGVGSHIVRINAPEDPRLSQIEIIYNIDSIGISIPAEVVFNRHERTISYIYSNGIALNNSNPEIEYITFRININDFNVNLTFINEPEIYHYFNLFCQSRYEEYNDTCVY